MNITPVDITTPAEYEVILDKLPDHLRACVQDRIHLVEELLLDLGVDFGVKLDGIRIDYPVTVTKTDLEKVMSRLGRKFRADGRQGIDGTLHRVSAEFDENGLVNSIIFRVARVTAYVAEPLRNYIELARGILVIGPPAVGKTTLLRDIARIRGETLGKGLVIIDSSNEITGDGDTPHPFLSHVRRVKVGDPAKQAEKIGRAVRNGGPSELLLDEVGYNDDVKLVARAANLGITAISTLHGATIEETYRNDMFWLLLGLSRDTTDGRMYRRQSAAFTLAIEVRAKGRYVVHPDVNAAVDALTRDEQPEGLRVGNWPEFQAPLLAS